jgi:hypothetical protein
MEGISYVVGSEGVGGAGSAGVSPPPIPNNFSMSLNGNKARFRIFLKSSHSVNFCLKKMNQMIANTANIAINRMANPRRKLICS